MKMRGGNLQDHFRQTVDHWACPVPNRSRVVVLGNFEGFWNYDFDTDLDMPKDKPATQDLPTRCGQLAFLANQKPAFNNDREACEKLTRFLKNITMAALALVLVFCFSACATRQPTSNAPRREFVFNQDTFAFSNELVWEYYFDAKGKWTNRRREPAPDYSHHCFVVAHCAKQFFRHANFAPELNPVDDATYRKLIRKVISQSDLAKESAQIIFPGYANLREFSDAKENLLKEECGGAWRSYFQRGHWRIMLPFSRNQQKITSVKLKNALKEHEVVVAHLVRFPQLTINHAVVLIDAKSTEQGTEFSVYDPNNPEKPSRLIFDEASRTFQFPGNDYFMGGKVNVYEVYRSCFY